MRPTLHPSDMFDSTVKRQVPKLWAGCYGYSHPKHSIDPDILRLCQYTRSRCSLDLKGKITRNQWL